jgi:SPP1 family predicted phage head-tail adaptor
MRWGDVIKLISITNAVNGMGDTTETPTERQVYANKTSVKRAEFYQAQAVGLKPEIVLEVKLIDYEGEKKLLYEGEEYDVIREYSKDGENIELICNRLNSNIAINLTALAVTTATLVPAFDGATYIYTASVANAIASVVITPTCAMATEITVNGTRVESAAASGAVALVVGANIITIIMRKTARPTRTYTITITRAA